MKTYHRLRIFLFIFLFSLLTFSSSMAEENLPKIVKRIEPSAVVILTYDNEGKALGQGSGFFISKSDIITNVHVLQGASRADVKISNGKVYPVTRVVAEDKQNDIIRISAGDVFDRAAGFTVHPLAVSSSIPNVGERIIVIGSPLGLETTVSDGIVSAVRELPGFEKIIQITAAVSPGSSGSPVVNMKGEVIGVVVSQMVEGQNLNFAIPGEKIANLGRFISDNLAVEKSFAEWAAAGTEKWSSPAKELVDAGDYFLLREDYEKALSYFKKALEKNNPGYFFHAYFGIGMCYAKLSNYNDAIEAFKQSIRFMVVKKNAYLPYFYLGQVYGKQEHYDEAIESFKRAIGIKPDYAEAYYMLGVTYDILRHFDEANEALKQAVRIRPDYAEAYFALSESYVGLERDNEAIESLNQAIRIKPDYVEAHYFLGLMYSGMNDRNSALQEYKILKDLDKEKANKLFNFIYK